jgi:hypothetical protein
MITATTDKTSKKCEFFMGLFFSCCLFFKYRINKLENKGLIKKRLKKNLPK